MTDIPDTKWIVQDSSQGRGTCHRARFLIIPRSLGVVAISRPPCTGPSCALWDPDLKQCRDVSNANWLVEIAKVLEQIQQQLGTIPCHPRDK